jgi:hypothetical protein
MHNNLKSVVEFLNLKNRPKFLCIKKMKGSYNLGLGNLCDLFGECSDGTKQMPSWHWAVSPHWQAVTLLSS